MLKKEQIEEIKQILNSGYNFDLGLIAFEYDTSIEEIRKIKEELEATKRDVNVGERKKDLKQEQEIKLKIARMKTKYKLETKKTKIEYKISRRELTTEQREFVEHVIETLEKQVEEHKNDTGLQRRKILSDTLKNIREILNLKCDLNPNELARMWHILDSNTFKNMTLVTNDNIMKTFKSFKRIVAKQLGDSITYEKNQAKGDLEKLEYLKQLITTEMANEDYFSLGSLSNSLVTEIVSIKNKKRQEEAKNRIPEEFKQIIQGLENSSLDLEQANNLIESLVKKESEKIPENKFKLSDELIRKGIITRIVKIFENQYIRYNFKEPKKAIEELVLLGGDKSTIVKSVLQNLVQREELYRAKELYREIIDEDSNMKNETYPMEYVIRNLEIRNMVLRIVNGKASIEEEHALYQVIENGIRRKNINLKSIILGKKGDGIRNLTLADIWEEEKER